MRGEEYREGDKTITKAQVKKRALKLVKDARKRNNRTNQKNTEDLDLLRRLYEQIVPSCLLDEKGDPKTGSANNANEFFSPLTDPDSDGLKPRPGKPDWMKEMEKGTDEKVWKPDSEGWLKEYKLVGRPAKWHKEARKGNPWQQLYLDYCEKQKKQNVNRELIQEMRESGLMPLFLPHLKGVSAWNRGTTTQKRPTRKSRTT